MTVMTLPLVGPLLDNIKFLFLYPLLYELFPLQVVTALTIKTYYDGMINVIFIERLMNWDPSVRPNVKYNMLNV
jgi:hypothetical protein